MAKRGRRPKGTLAGLAAELEHVNARRHQLIQRIRQIADAMASGESPLPWLAGAGGAVGPEAASPRRRRGGRRKGFKMSKAARAKISAAAKKRWAERKKKKG